MTLVLVIFVRRGAGKMTRHLDHLEGARVHVTKVGAGGGGNLGQQVLHLVTQTLNP